MFKEFYKSQRDDRLNQLNELYSMLSEADANETEVAKKVPEKISDFYGKTVRLLQTGINGLIEDPTRKKVTVDSSDEFTVLDPKTANEAINNAKADGEYTFIIAVGSDKAKATFLNNDDEISIPVSYINTMFDTEVRSKFTPADKELFDKIAGQKRDGNYTKSSRADALALLTMLNKINSERKSGPRFGYYILQNNETGHIFKILVDLTRPATKPEMTINKRTLYSGGGNYKPNSNAQHPESLQLAGFFFDAEEMERKIVSFAERNSDLDVDNPSSNQDFLAIVEPYAEAFSKGDHRDFKSEFVKIYKNFTVQDWINNLAYAKSCSIFNREVSKFTTPHILHDSISEYRTLEAAKLGREADVKQSVVDALVSDVPAENLIEFIKLHNSKLRANKERGCIEVHKNGTLVATYYQLSLKVEENNKLGRGHRNLKKKYGFAAKAQDLYDHEVHYEDLLLAEGVIEKLSKAASDGLKVLKLIGKDLFEKLLKVAGALKSWKVKLINQIKNSYDSHFVSDTMALFGLASLNESSIEGAEFKHIIEKIAKSPDLKAKYAAANAKIEKALNNIASSKYGKYYRVRFNTPNITSIKKGAAEHVLAGMAFNYAYIQAFNRMLVTNTGAEHIETYVDELVDLYVDSIFGSTELPVWKLFSKTEKVDKPYVYMGIKKDNKEERVNSILAHDVENAMPLVILDATSIGDGLHHIQMYVLSKVVNDNGTFNPMYVWYNISYDKKAYGKGILKPFFMAKAEIHLKEVEKIED